MAEASRPSTIRVDASACDPQDLSPCGGVTVVVPGDHPWDELVDLAVTSGWPGLETLAGAAATTAEAVAANAAAHGQAVADVVASVRTWDRAVDAQRTFAAADCGFTPAGSLLGAEHQGRPRYEVLDVTFLFKEGDLTRPLLDTGLAELLGVELGARVPLGLVRAALG